MHIRKTHPYSLSLLLLHVLAHVYHLWHTCAILKRFVSYVRVSAKLHSELSCWMACKTNFTCIKCILHAN